MTMPCISRNRGLTLIEVMIGMVIGLIGIIIITQVYLVNENFKRSTTGAGGAQVNGAIALYTLERDLRMAGYGIAHSDALSCGQLRYYYNGNYSTPPGGTLPNVVVAPVVITDGGAGPDTIRVMYATGEVRNVPATLSKNMADAAAALNVDNPTGFSQNPGDLIFVSQGGVCTLMQVTQEGVPLHHVASGTALWNPSSPAASFTAYTQGALVYNLGRPVVNTYSINSESLTYSIESNSLQLHSMFTATSSTVVQSYNPPLPISLISDIVDLRAKYGKDNGVNNGTVTNTSYSANDGIVDSYDNVTPTTAAGWQQVLSIRIAVLARSENYEKPDPTCTATLNLLPWLDGTPEAETFAVPGGFPSCYKYRVFDTVVPLRNMLWRQS